MRLCVALALLLLTCSSSLAAEAVTYKGTIGKTPIILELAEANESGEFVGRYAYLSRGGDIPLHGTTNADGRLAIQEEAPCTKELCRDAKDEIVEKAPIGAEWTLRKSDDEQKLTGSWKDIKSGKTLDLKFALVASRKLPDGDGGVTLYSLDPSSVARIDDHSLITQADLPYDFLKMDVPLKKGAEVKYGDGVYRLDMDPRVEVEFPTIVRIGKTDIAPINAYLHQQRLQFSFNSFYCLSKAYLGMDWSGSGGEGGMGYDGPPSVVVNLLTPRLLGISEGGSFFCGGAYPDNFLRYQLADVKTGKPLEPETLLKGWVAKDADGKIVDPSTVEDKSDLKFGPSDELIKYVNDKRDRSDASRDEECGLSDLVTSNLGVYFTQDEMIFTLKNLPHVIFACGDDLVTVPLKDARPLLTDAGARYFAVLDR
ncbi:hypothetical protein IHQ71_22415 [Rhizobium sp. TH2]|uniref:hypothetical protein n=1 Tax=Rhizobium sp. TH2 TaxID=2775403 RepID=UPI0021576F39|nr:hypothetical protein [Rhizobium sp. TH2]UVC07908.1 hypothetical protein IHQ71_22415 [Rhizobium sp. TH2]